MTDSTQDVINAFLAAMAEDGMIPTRPIIADGALKRVHLEGHDPGTNNGAYALHLDPPPSGWYQDHKWGGEIRKWRFNGTTKPMSPEEKKRFAKKVKAEQAKRDAERKAKHDAAAIHSNRVVKSFPLYDPMGSTAHKYHAAKENKGGYGERRGTWTRWVVDEHGNKVKITVFNVLLAPIYNSAGKIRNVQAIFPEVHPVLKRNKDFMPGSELEGCFFFCGPRPTDPGCTVLICEGVATGYTLFEQTGLRTYIAFTAGNLLAVAQIVRARLPHADIVICGDNDALTKKDPGRTKATEAAAAIKGRILIPPEPGDWNDYWIKHKDALNV
ncbi:toprim domain-containing protein [Methylicorpusculum oleiharenae]|uniref:toprim domain-containing protein n=1 Tax=Methylicorpusculum oleiharenae TaxID=1338687 RepID=UPI00135A19DA|nr:toprim domain-containing protein [Methylicorpusculum oleiharenae]MCD2449309.1 toprim domain-containing protein [Methylicorpusculum oleiharenae]